MKGLKHRVPLIVLIGTLLLLLACAPATQPASAPAAAAPAAPAAAPKAPAQPAAPAPAAAPAAAPAPVAAPAPAAPARSTGPQYGGTQVRVIQQGRLPHLEPIMTVTGTVHPEANLVYTRLVRWDWDESPNKPVIKPDMAEKWEVSRDGLTMTFHLAKGVKFQENTDPPFPGLNGRELTSADVKYSFERAAYAPISLFQSVYRSVDKFEAPDPYTFVIKLKEFDADFFTMLAAKSAWIVPKELVEKYGDLKTVMLGAGPFIYEKWVKDIVISFRKNPNYYKKGLPYSDRFEQVFIQDVQTQRTAFRTGKITRLTVDKADFEDILKTKPDMQYLRYLITTTTMLGMHYRNPIFQDIRFRKAILLALDHNNLVKVITDNDGIRRGPVSGQHEGWALSQKELNELLPYDPAQARKLMQELGYDKGIEMEMLTESPGSVGYVAAAQLVVENFKAIGINLKLDIVPNAIHRRRRDAQDYKDFFWGPDGQPTPLTHLTENYRTGGAKNVMALNDPKLDAWIDKIASTVDEEERRKEILEIQRWLLKNYHYKTAIADRYTYDMWQPNVRNLKPRPPHFLGLDWNVESVWIER